MSSCPQACRKNPWLRKESPIRPQVTDKRIWGLGPVPPTLFLAKGIGLGCRSLGVMSIQFNWTGINASMPYSFS